MKVTKKTEALFEIEFDEYELEKLKDLETVFEVDAADFLRRSFDQNLKNCTANIDYLVNKVKTKVDRDNGN